MAVAPNRKKYPKQISRLLSFAFPSKETTSLSVLNLLVEVEHVCTCVCVHWFSYVAIFFPYSPCSLVMTQSSGVPFCHPSPTQTKTSGPMWVARFTTITSYTSGAWPDTSWLEKQHWPAETGEMPTWSGRRRLPNANVSVVHRMQIFNASVSSATRWVFRKVERELEWQHKLEDTIVPSLLSSFWATVGFYVEHLANAGMRYTFWKRVYSFDKQLWLFLADGIHVHRYSVWRHDGSR